MESLRSSYVRKVRRKSRIKWKLSYIGPDGRRHEETTSATSRRAAERLLVQKLKEVERQIESGTQDITYGDFCAKYLLHQKSAVEPSTYRRCREVVDRTSEIWGRRPLKHLRLRDVQQYVNERAQVVYKWQNGTTKKIAPGTVERELTVLSGIFSRAVEWDYLVKNPAKKVKLRKYERRKQRILEGAEEARLFYAFTLGDRRGYLKDVCTVALHTGMREGEILGLKWAAVDFTTKFITVESTNENPNKGKRTRPIPMSRKVQESLSRLHLDALRETKGTPITIRDRYVFINPRTGTRYMDTHMAWYASRKDAGIKGFRFHDLRHYVG